MSKIVSIIGGGLLLATTAFAAVTVDAGPTSLVTSDMTVGASSSQISVFSFELTGDDSETLSSVTVQLDNNGSSDVTSGDIASVRVYRDNGNGSFNSGTDLLAGSESAVNIGSETVIETNDNNDLSAEAVKFFVTLGTDSSWGETDPLDSIEVTLVEDGVETSQDSPSTNELTTSTISAEDTEDGDGPELISAVAKNTGGSSAKEDGDTVVFTFDEETNKATINASNINSVLDLNNSHSFLDGDGNLGSTTWNSAGTVLTVTISDDTSLPTVAVGDVVTVSGSVIKDADGNNADGSETISGSFVGASSDDDDDCTEVQASLSNDDSDDDQDADEDSNNDDEDNDCDNSGPKGEGQGKSCGNALVNGKLYKVADSPTVYLAAACRLKPFRGAAAFHARGLKFQNIIVLSSLSGLEVSSQPALPAEGTLVKGSAKTVWFIDSHGKRKGFTSETVFKGLGFKFDQVNEISDDDLNTMPEDSDAIKDESEHPDGSIVKCGNSAEVFEVIGGTRFPFANGKVFTDRGHAWGHIAVVDCGRFHYTVGAAIQE